MRLWRRSNAMSPVFTFSTVLRHGCCLKNNHDWHTYAGREVGGQSGKLAPAICVLVVAGLNCRRRRRTCRRQHRYNIQSVVTGLRTCTTAWHERRNRTLDTCNCRKGLDWRTRLGQGLDSSLSPCPYSLLLAAKSPHVFVACISSAEHRQNESR